VFSIAKLTKGTLRYSRRTVSHHWLNAHLQKKLTAKSKEIWFYEEAKNSRDKQRQSLPNANSESAEEWPVFACAVF